jgi:hypothetical protein
MNGKLEIADYDMDQSIRQDTSGTIYRIRVHNNLNSFIKHLEILGRTSRLLSLIRRDLHKNDV